MGQPKKLTHNQRVYANKQGILVEKLLLVRIDLKSIWKDMQGKNVDFAMCRQAAFDVFRHLQDASEFPQTDNKVEMYIEKALELARDAQACMNFRNGF